MEIFITLTKYNTCQRREEGNPLLVVNYLVSIYGICHTPHQAGENNTRSFVRWIQAYARSPDTPGCSKNALVPVVSPLKRGTSDVVSILPTLTLVSWEAGGRIVGALWGVAARTCSILLATFLCSCRLASPAV